MSRRYADATVEGEDVERTTPPPVPADGLTTGVEHHYVHPDTAAMFAVAPWTQHIPLFSESSKGVGPKCTAALGAVYFLNKGLSKNLVALSRYAMFRSRFGIDGTRYQRLVALYKMGMSVKAFSASVSDTFALFDYTKQ